MQGATAVAQAQRGLPEDVYALYALTEKEIRVVSRKPGEATAKQPPLSPQHRLDLRPLLVAEIRRVGLEVEA